MRAHRDTRLCSSRQRNIHWMTVPRIFCAAPESAPVAADAPFGESPFPRFGNCRTEPVLMTSATSAVMGLLYATRVHLSTPFPALPEINWEETGLRIHEARCDYCRLEQHPVQPPQLPQQPPFFLSFRSLAMARPAADTRTANTMISPIVPPLYANADAGIRILVSSEHQAAKACQRRQRGNGHKAEAGLPRQ